MKFDELGFKQNQFLRH